MSVRDELEKCEYLFSLLCTCIQLNYVQVYSVMSVRDELEKCEYICSVLCTCIQLNVLCTGVQCNVST